MINASTILDFYRHLVDSGDVDVDALLGIELPNDPDLDAALEAFATAIGSDGIFQTLLSAGFPTSITATEVVYSDGTNSLTVGITGFSSVPAPIDLLNVLFGTHPTARVAELTGVADGETLFEATFSETLYAIDVGGLLIEIDGTFPLVLVDLFDLAGGLDDVLSAFNPVTNDSVSANLAPLIETVQATAFRATFDDTLVASTSFTDSSFSIMLGGAKMEILGDFDDLSVSPSDFAALLYAIMAGDDSFSVPGLPSDFDIDVSSLIICDDQDNVVFEIDFPEDGSEGGSLTVTGTSGKDTGIQDYASEFFEFLSGGFGPVTDEIDDDDDDDGEGPLIPILLSLDLDQVIFDLKGGGDSFTFDLNTRSSAPFFGIIGETFSGSDDDGLPDVHVEGGGGYDIVTILDDFSSMAIDINWRTGTVTATEDSGGGDDFVVFDSLSVEEDDDPFTISMTFADIERFVVGVHFDGTTATGNGKGNKVQLTSWDGEFQFDGRGGRDTLDLTKLNGFLGSFSPFFSNGVSFQEFIENVRVIDLGDGSYEFQERQYGGTLGTLTDVEIVKFRIDGKGTNFDIEDLVDPETEQNYDNILGDDVLVSFFDEELSAFNVTPEYGYVQTNYFGSTPITPLANMDFNGDGFADIVVQKANGNYQVLSPFNSFGFVDVEATEIGRGSSTFLGAMDHDGDGVDGMFFRRGDGTYYLLEDQGETVLNYGRRDFDFVGIGDFNGDGKEDMLMTKEGTNDLFRIRGDNNKNKRIDVSEESEVVGLGDVDGDGTTDIILERVSNGTKSAIDKDGNTIVTYFRKSAELVGMGDFDGDMVDDLVFVKDDKFTILKGSDRSEITSFDLPGGTFIGILDVDPYDDVEDIVGMNESGEFFVINTVDGSTNSFSGYNGYKVFGDDGLGINALGQFEIQDFTIV
ncbi:MAG: VCBS repeat-containing protein [Pseudomonadota bacterium]